MPAWDHREGGKLGREAPEEAAKGKTKEGERSWKAASLNQNGGVKRSLGKKNCIQTTKPWGGIFKNGLGTSNGAMMTPGSRV